MYNPYIIEANRLAAIGFDKTPLSDPVTVYSTKTGRVVHTTQFCGAFSKTDVQTEIVTPTNAELSFCLRCSTTDDLMLKLRAVTQITNAVKVFKDSETEPPLFRLVKLQTCLETFNSLLEYDSTAVWSADIQRTIHQVESAISTLIKAFSDTTPLMRSCAAGGYTGGMYADVTLPSITNPFDRRSRRYLSDGLDLFKHSLLENGDYEIAKQKAFADITSKVGDVPETFSQLPLTTELDRADFATLDLWLAAEWRLVRDKEIGKVVSQWAADVETKVSRSRTMPDQVMLVEKYHMDRLTLMYMAPFCPIQAAQAPQFLVVRVPALVADYLRITQRRRAVSEDAVESDNGQTLNLVAALLEPHIAGSPLSTLVGTLEAARALC